jgi:hypothetical protein
MTQNKQRKGRSFLGTLFLLMLGFAIGFYNVEILAFAVQSLRSR